MRSSRREPHRSKAALVARRVLSDLGIRDPTEAPIELLAYLRGVVVTQRSVRGARASRVGVSGRAIVSVAEGLRYEERRFAIAHELGHHELHPGTSYAGLCTGRDMLSAYTASGHEQEANAFAAEFLMPASLAEKRCDVRKVEWPHVQALATAFDVSLMSAALRFVHLCPERVALVCSENQRVKWSWPGPTFGHRISKDRPLDAYSLAVDLWERGRVPDRPETVSASAWLDRVGDDAELIEHALVLGGTGLVLSLLWISHDASF